MNRANPNAHQGVIYCSNLCTEIAQNMSPIESVSTEICTDEGDTMVVRTVRPGDFVVCNLASLSLGHLPLEDAAQMEQKVATLVRALDNVIDLNLYPMPFAQITNHRYRSIGLGVSGYHHALTVRGIRRESEEHLKFADELFDMEIKKLKKNALFNPNGDTDVRLRRMIGGNTTNLNDFNNMRYT